MTDTTVVIVGPAMSNLTVVGQAAAESASSGSLRQTFARIIDWEFPYFEVEKYKENLFKAQEILEKEGVIKGRIHRYYFVARKKQLNYKFSNK